MNLYAKKYELMSTFLNQLETYFAVGLTKTG
jgi:hypothetical protein